jgi:hypothetical protein
MTAVCAAAASSPPSCPISGSSASWASGADAGSAPRSATATWSSTCAPTASMSAASSPAISSCRISDHRRWPGRGAAGAGLRQALGKPVSEVCHRFEPVPQILKNVRFTGGKPLRKRGQGRHRRCREARFPTAAVGHPPLRHRAADPRHGRGRRPTGRISMEPTTSPMGRASANSTRPTSRARCLWAAVSGTRSTIIFASI